MSKTIDKPSDLLNGETGDYWLQELEAAKDRNSKWYDRAEEAENRYRDEKERTFGSYNILWANIETQKSALGEDFGKPEVSRVNAPEMDGGLSRFVSLVLERTLDGASKDTNDNRQIQLSVHDVLLPGRGQVWLELNPREDTEGNVWVDAPLVRLPYRDYLEGPANSWEGVPWVARGHLYTKDDLKDLSPDKWDKVPLDYEIECPESYEKDKKKKDQFKRARVWEIWAKYPTKRRLYIAEGHNVVLKSDDDPYNLRGFFPCPRPMLANGDELWQQPITDYSRYQDQAEELDRVCQRIHVLLDALRRRGVFDKRCKELADLAEADDNVLIGIENYESLTIGDQKRLPVQWEDLQPTIGVLTQLYQQRNSLRDLIYELTGISDLIRGMTNPHETAKAQMMKMTFGSGRFQNRIIEARRFASDSYAIKGELIAEHFPRSQIEAMSGLALPLQTEITSSKQSLAALQAVTQQLGSQPPIDPKALQRLQKAATAKFAWEDVHGVLSSDEVRSYKVAVSTDQTRFKDEEADKASRIEFFQVFNSSLQSVAPLIAGNPHSGEMYKQMLMFVLSSFKAGRSLEEGIEQAIDAAIQKATAQQSQQPPQDPSIALKVQKAQLEVEEQQLRNQKAMIELQAIQAKYGIEAQHSQLKAVESQQKLVSQHEENQADSMSRQIKLQGDVERLAFERAKRATADEVIRSGPTVGAI